MQKISKEHVVRTFAAEHQPAARVRPGDVFVMETNDRFRDWHEGKSWPMEQLAVMTGPVYVEGAKPGQVLAIDILDIRPSQGFGYVVAIPGYGAFKDQVEFRKKIVQIEGNHIRYSEHIALPYVQNVSKIGQTMGEGATVEAAVHKALAELAQLLMERTGADMTEAAMLVSIAADVRISEMGGNLCHVRVAMAREILGM